MPLPRLKAEDVSLSCFLPTLAPGTKLPGVFPPMEKDMFGKLFTSNSTASEMDASVQRAIAQAQINKSMTQGTAYITNGGGGGAVLSSQGPQWIHQEETYGRVAYERMIYLRLQGVTDANPVATLFDFLAAHRLTDDKMAVFVCNNGSYVVIEDDTNMFPSDALITQLRMLQK